MNNVLYKYNEFCIARISYNTNKTGVCIYKATSFIWGHRPILDLQQAIGRQNTTKVHVA